MKRGQTILIILVILIAISGTTTYFVLKTSSDSELNIPYYFLAVHGEPGGAFPQNFMVLKEFIEYANNYNMKITNKSFS